MKPFLVCFLFCLSSLFTAATAHAEKPWVEVRSPHFRVLTNGTARDGQRVAANFEQMRYVFVRELSGFRLDSGAPLTIFAMRDEKTSRRLDAWMWKMKGRKPTVLFKYGKERQYAMVRLDALGTEPNLFVAVQYALSVVRLNSYWLFPWLNTGLAEFYGSTQYQEDKIEIGAPAKYSALLQGTPIPVRTLISEQAPRLTKDNWKEVAGFDAESWALVHYLTFGNGMEEGQKINQFFGMLRDGEDQGKSFEQVFGSPEGMDRPFDQYIHNLAFDAAVIRNPPKWKETDFVTRELTPAETEAELAGYRLWKGDSLDAHPMVAAALEYDPKLGLAHEENGFLLFAQGKDAESEGEFSAAYRLDSTLYLSLFAKTMMSPLAHSNTPGDEAALHDALLKVVDLNPQFAPAYVEMARLEVRRGNLPLAYGLSRRAEQLEPSRAGYYLMTGEILHRMGRDAEAAADAQYVAKHGKGANHDAAVDLWNSIPEKQRPAGAALQYEALPGTNTVAGVVEQVNCGTAADDTVVLRHDGKQLTFRISDQHTTDMPDTYWYGSDHFALCHHLGGMPAVLRYRPAADASYTGDVAEIDIRDDLPAPSNGKSGMQLAAKP